LRKEFAILRKQLLPKQSLFKEEEAPKFEYNFDIINKQIDKLRLSLLEVGKDGIIDPTEYGRILLELQLLENLLISFKNDKFRDAKIKSREFYENANLKIGTSKAFTEEEKKFGFKQGENNKGNNTKILYEKHILEYFGALIELATEAGFKVESA
jgi:hypothetical protein